METPSNEIGPAAEDAFTLGYDVRDLAEVLDGRRRASVETVWWPSLLEGAGRGEFRGRNADLWDDPDALLRGASAGRLAAARPVLVRVVAFVPRELARGDAYPLYPPDEERPAYEGGLELLGFDVADRDLMSALRNFSDEEVATLGVELNRFSLAPGRGEADRLIWFANREYPEHAPFNAMAVYVGSLG